MVARALNIVPPAQRIRARPWTHVVAGPASSKFEIAVDVSDPMMCCVTPIAHKMQTLSASGNHVRDFLQHLDSQAHTAQLPSPS